MARFASKSVSVEPIEARRLGHEFSSYGVGAPQSRVALCREMTRLGWNVLARRRALACYDYDVRK